MHNTEHKRQGLIGHTPKHGVWKFSGVSSTFCGGFKALCVERQNVEAHRVRSV